MKNDFLLAITQLAAERNLPKQVVFSAVEQALVSAYKKDDFGATHNISVKIHPVSGEVRVFILKEVVEKVEDPNRHMTLVEAKKEKKDAELGETIPIEITSMHGGRIAAQTAKQVVLQRLREAEREFILGEYISREGELISGIVQRVDPKQVILDLGKTEGMLPAPEQVKTERYRVGQRLKVFLLEVNRGTRGPRLIVSRSHPNLVKRLFELEVPEIRNASVEIKAIAREPGFRTKVAVAAVQEGVDPVGSCVGLRGVRIQNVVNELNGERIDVILWNPLPKTFVANALSPAQVVSVDIKEEEKTAVVIVPDGQLSLAIGKEGQNARLAARLTGWKIDIKASSLIEAEKAVKAAAVAAEKEAAKAKRKEKALEEAVVAEAALPEEAGIAVPVPAMAEPIEIPLELGEEPVPAAPVEEEVVEPVEEEGEIFPLVEQKVAVPGPGEKPVLRFAEDIFGAQMPRGIRPGKKKFGEKDEAGKPKKKRKARAPAADEGTEEF